MGTRRREGRPAPATARSAGVGTRQGSRNCPAASCAARASRNCRCHDRRADWAGPGGAVASRRSDGRRRAGRGPHHRPSRAGKMFPGGHQDSAGEAGTKERPRPGKDL